jgi:hypothetical protein
LPEKDDKNNHDLAANLEKEFDLMFVDVTRLGDSFCPKPRLE